MPDFVQTEIKAIDDQLRILKDEASRLEAARAARRGGPRRRGGPATNGAARTSARPASRRRGRQAAPRPRRGGNTRAHQALELVRERPGITIPEIAKAIKIEPNYLYRVLPRLASDGHVKRDGQGWHPSSSTSTTARPVGNVRARKQTRATKSEPAASAPRAKRAQRTAASTPATNGRTAPGATKASVLAALAGGEAMTAGQVATKGRLARPTVSTTLSKLAKTGEVQKAERGYRLSSTA
jgi:DNA-binding MarR family transcriptional regulator